MSEQSITADWIRDTLVADATLVSLVGTRVYDTLAPQDTPLPYIIFQRQGGRDVRGATEGTRIMSNALYLVKMIAQSGSYDAVDPGEARIDALLHAKRGTALGGTVVACYREDEYTSKYAIDGKYFVEKGGFYRCLTQR